MENENQLQNNQMEIVINEPDGNRTLYIAVTNEMRQELLQNEFWIKEHIRSIEVAWFQIAELCHNVKSKNLFAAAGFHSFREWAENRFNVSYRTIERYLDVKKSFPALISQAANDPDSDASRVAASFGINRILNMAKVDGIRELIEDVTDPNGYALFLNGEQITYEQLLEMSPREQDKAILEMKRQLSNMRKQYEEQKKISDATNSDLSNAQRQIELIGGEDGVIRARRINDKEGCIGAIITASGYIEKAFSELRKINIEFDDDIDGKKKDFFKTVKKYLNQAVSHWEDFVNFGNSTTPDN